MNQTTDAFMNGAIPNYLEKKVHQEFEEAFDEMEKYVKQEIEKILASEDTPSFTMQDYTIHVKPTLYIRKVENEIPSSTK